MNRRTTIYWGVAIVATAFLTSGVCRAAAGVTFGMFVGTLVLLSILTPIVTTGVGRLPGAVAVAGIVAVSGALPWLSAVRAGLSLVDWCKCLVVLGGLMIGQAVLVVAIEKWKSPRPWAVGIVSIVTLLWLTWPVWAATVLPGHNVDKLVAVQPLMAINQIVQPLGIWTEQPVAYNLTTLGQDVPYTLPRSIWGATAVPILVGTVMAGVAWFGTRRGGATPPRRD